LGENPCNVDKIFRKIKQCGALARQAGGVCGIEMACMDLAGKAWGVPCWQMLGGKFRDRVRLYADTTETEDPKEQANRLKRSEEHTSELQSHRDLHSFPTRRSSDLCRAGRCSAASSAIACASTPTRPKPRIRRNRRTG